MFLNFIEVVLTVNVVDRTLQGLQVSQVLVNLGKVVLPLDFKDWANKRLQVGWSRVSGPAR